MCVCVASIVLFSSCDRENMDFGKDADTYGQVRLSSLKLTANVDATPASRAATVDVSNYIVGIYDADTDQLVSEWKYSEMPELFQLKVGNYKVFAHAPNTEGAAFDEPYCEGSKTFAISKDQVTNLETVKCTLSSIMVTIQYEEAFKQLLGDDVNVKVSVGAEKIDFKKDETRSAYFHGTATNNIVDIHFVGTIDGEENVSITRSYSGIELGYQVILTYSLKDADGDPGTGGGINMALKVDTRCDIVTLDGSVLPDKEPGIDDFPSGGGEEPGGDDPTIKNGNPKLDLLNAVLNANTYNAETDGPALVNLQASRRISNIIVDITSDNEEFRKALDDLFGGPSFDLANPPADIEHQRNLEGLGFPIGDAVRTTDVVAFNISEFVPLLPAYPGSHTFKITVKDVTNAFATATLRIEANK